MQSESKIHNEGMDFRCGFREEKKNLPYEHTRGAVIDVILFITQLSQKQILSLTCPRILIYRPGPVHRAERKESAHP